MTVFFELKTTDQTTIVWVVPNGKTWKVMSIGTIDETGIPMEIYYQVPSGSNSYVHRQGGIVAPFTASIGAKEKPTVDPLTLPGVYRLPDIKLPTGSEVNLARSGTIGTWSAIILVDDQA